MNKVPTIISIKQDDTEFFLHVILTKISGSRHVTLNVDNKTTSDDFIIANHFNSFFTPIA